MNRKAIFLILLFFPILLRAQQECSFDCVPEAKRLEYDGYHLVFQDEFRYDTALFKMDSVFQSKWITERGKSNNSSGRAWYSAAQVSMPRYGLIRLSAKDTTDFVINNDSISHVSGNLVFRFPYYASLGILEARMKLPKQKDYGRPTIWVVALMGPSEGPRHTEINILDQHDGRTDKVTANTFFWVDMTTISNRHEPTDVTLKEHGTTDLSDTFHTYSYLWTPWRVTIFLDRRYVTHFDYDKDCDGARTFPDKYELRIALQTHPKTRDGTYMDIDYVRYYEQNCNNSDLLIDSANRHLDFMCYPTLLPRHGDFNMLKFNTITMNGGREVIRTQNDIGTMLESRSTTISSNFIADQSRLVSGPFPQHPANGFFEIKSMADCPDYAPVILDADGSEEAPFRILNMNEKIENK